jgi:hypothetical protein
LETFRFYGSIGLWILIHKVYTCIQAAYIYSKPDKLPYMLETKNESLAELRFVGKISKMGDRMIITIPPEYHEQARKLKGKHLRVVADDQW